MHEFDSERLDCLLKMIDDSADGRMLKGPLLDEEKAPEDWSRAIAFLVEEGYIKESRNYLEITYKGRVLVHEGGFRSKDRRERVLRYSSLVAAVCSLLSLLVALTALIC
jgi:hypothetical protein